VGRFWSRAKQQVEQVTQISFAIKTTLLIKLCFGGLFFYASGDENANN